MSLNPPANSLPSPCFIQSQVIGVSEVLLILPRKWIDIKDPVNMHLPPSLECATDPYSEIADPLGWGTETSVLCIYS